jgi:SAM-dependent methyltransferase
MDRDELSRRAHAGHPVAAPVGPGAVDALLGELTPATGGRVLDLGCGAGEWLLRLLAGRPDLRGVGVDCSPLALDEARRRARELGVADRVGWVEGDGASWADGDVEVALCIGATHAFGGLSGTLRALRGHLAPGGQALLGDGFWERPPSHEAQAALEAGPDDMPDLPGLVATAREHGFEVGYGHVSTLEEWDDYEWSWTGSLVRWALHEAPSEDARNQALEAARTHRDEWLRGYRGELGFATLVLHPVEAGVVIA